jgi:hypothetical protein
MKAEEFLKEKSDWFDKSPAGEKLYFESEVIRMMNEYAIEALRVADVIEQSEQFCECDGVQELIDGTGECRKCGGQCTY